MTDFTKELGNINDINEIIEKPITINPSEASEGARAEIDVAVSTAHAFPRDLQKALKNILFLATQDKETAESCFYSVIKDGKTIRGASIKLANIITSCYGNIRSSASIIANDGKSVTARGVCWDLESNNAYSIEAIRKITDVGGKTISEDMQILESMAACSIALRNAIFKVIPEAITSRIQNEIRKIVMGETADFETIRKDTVDTFIKQGVPERNILALFDKKTVEDLTRDDVFDLRGIATAIKEKDTTLASAFSIAKPNAISKASKQLGDLPSIPTNNQQDSVNDVSPLKNLNNEKIENASYTEEVETEKKVDLGEVLEKRKNNKAN